MTRTRANDILGLPGGGAAAQQFIEKQSSESDPAIELLTIPETAEFLRISVSGVRRLQQGRQIPFFKIGGGIRFAKGDLVSYLTRQRIGSVGQ